MAAGSNGRSIDSIQAASFGEETQKNSAGLWKALRIRLSLGDAGFLGLGLCCVGCGSGCGLRRKKIFFRWCSSCFGPSDGGADAKKGCDGRGLVVSGC